MCECKKCGESYIGEFINLDGLCPRCEEEAGKVLTVRLGKSRYAGAPKVAFLIDGTEICTSFLNIHNYKALAIIERVDVKIDLDED